MSSHSAVVTLALDADAARIRAQRVLAELDHVAEGPATGEDGTIRVKTDAGMSSLGLFVTIELEPGGGSTAATVGAETTSFQLYDWGACQRRVESIVAALDAEPEDALLELLPEVPLSTADCGPFTEGLALADSTFAWVEPSERRKGLVGCYGTRAVPPPTAARGPARAVQVTQLVFLFEDESAAARWLDAKTAEAAKAQVERIDGLGSQALLVVEPPRRRSPDIETRLAVRSGRIVVAILAVSWRDMDLRADERELARALVPRVESLLGDDRSRVGLGRAEGRLWWDDVRWWWSDSAAGWFRAAALVVFLGLAAWGLIDATLNPGDAPAPPTAAPPTATHPSPGSRARYAGLTTREARDLAASDLAQIAGLPIDAGLVAARPRLVRTRCFEDGRPLGFWKVTFDGSSPVFESRAEALVLCSKKSNVSIGAAIYH